MCVFAYIKKQQKLREQITKIASKGREKTEQRGRG